MVYKNTIKVLFSNFSLVWKMILYFMILFLFCGGLLFLCIDPIVKLIEEAGFFEQIIELYAEFLTTLNLAKTMEVLSTILDSLFKFVIENLSNIWINIVGAGFIVFVLNSILYNLVSMANCLSLHFYIGSLTRQGFFASFKDVFWKNLKLQLCHFVISLPLNFFYFSLFFISLNMFGNSWLLNIIALLIVIVGFILLMAFKYMLFVAWIPSIVVMNYKTFKALRTGIKITFRQFKRFFSASVGVIITIIVLNMFLGLFTFMVGLLVSIPISYLLYNSLGMVITYEGQGMRYYVDIYNVITPKKKESADKLNELKYIV